MPCEGYARQGYTFYPGRLACCSLYRTTAFSPSRSARAAHACGLAAIFEPVTAALRRVEAGSGNPPVQPEYTVDNKSYVSMEQHLCVVCAKSFDTGNLLLDRRLKASMERHTTTGWGLCLEHQRLHSEGFVALVECDPLRSGSPTGNGSMKPEQACRTGVLAHLRREVFNEVFNVVIRSDQPVVFVEPGVIEQLQARVAPND